MESTKKSSLIVPVRPGWDEFFLDLAGKYSRRGTCFRRQYGAFIVDREKRPVSAGYCGAPSGVDNCLEVGYCYRHENDIPAGMAYEKCVSCHAEVNAVLFADDRSRLKDSTLYLAGWDVQKGAATASPPCINCLKVIIQMKIGKVVLLPDEITIRELSQGMKIGKVIPLSDERMIREISLDEMIDKLSKRNFDYPY